MQKYLSVVLKTNERREYRWDDIDFIVPTKADLFVVRETVTEELLFCTSFENILYYERIEKEEEN